MYSDLRGHLFNQCIEVEPLLLLYQMNSNSPVFLVHLLWPGTLPRYLGKYFNNQLINQISVVPISPLQPGSEAQQLNQYSTAKLMKRFHNSNGAHRSCWCLWEEGQAKEMSWNTSWRLQLKQLNGQIAAGCSREKGRTLKCSGTCVGLGPGARDRQEWFLFDHSVSPITHSENKMFGFQFR